MTPSNYLLVLYFTLKRRFTQIGLSLLTIFLIFTIVVAIVQFSLRSCNYKLLRGIMTNSETEQPHQTENLPTPPHVTVDIEQQQVSVETPDHTFLIQFHDGKNWQGLLHLFHAGPTSHASITDLASELAIQGADPGDSLVQQVRQRFYSRGQMPRFIKAVRGDNGERSYVVDADITIIKPPEAEQATAPSPVTDAETVPVKPDTASKLSTLAEGMRNDLAAIMPQVEEKYAAKERYTIEEVLKLSPAIFASGAMRQAVDRRIVLPDYDIKSGYSYLSQSDITVIYYIAMQTIRGRSSFPSSYISLIQATMNELLAKKREELLANTLPATESEPSAPPHDVFVAKTTREQSRPKADPKQQEAISDDATSVREKGGRFMNKPTYTVCTFMRIDDQFRADLAADESMSGIFHRLKPGTKSDRSANTIPDAIMAFHFFAKSFEQIQAKQETFAPVTQADILADWIYSAHAPELIATVSILLSNEQVRSTLEPSGLNNLAQRYNKLRTRWNEALPPEREVEKIPEFLKQLNL
jgi:hypothetical protein